MPRKKSRVQHKGKGNLSRIAKRLPLVATDVTETFAKEVVELAKNILSDSGKLSSSTLINSFSIDRVNVNQYASKLVIGNTAPYAVFIEYGRRPGSGRPPLEPIADWVMQRGITPNNPVAVPSTDALVFLIARAIDTNGIAPVFFMARAFGDAEVRRRLRRNFSLAFQEVAVKKTAKR